MKNQFSRIIINANKQQGRPCIKGTRITVYDILDYLSSGLSIKDIIENYPPLTKEDIVEALEFIKHLHSQTKYLTHPDATS